MLTRPARLVAAAALAATTASATPAVSAFSGGSAAPSAPAAAQDVRVDAAALTTYNDVRRSSQWALTRLQAEKVRSARTARGVVVAVIDSGVQANHPDLKGRVMTGWDFTTRSAGGTVDGYGHGTHVAGIIAANANNSTGVAGLTPDVTIMPLRVLDNDGAGWGSDVARALRYAADHGAKVANISIASRYSAAVADAVKYAQSKGVIVVAAAGNEKRSGNPVSYPANLPGVIGVAADDSSSRVAAFSNTGSYVDVTAPGVSVMSTYKGSGYIGMNGTSMATPHVSAAVALLVASKPGITQSEALGALARTARDLGAPGRDDATGYGEIRPLQAMCSVRRCI